VRLFFLTLNNMPYYSYVIRSLKNGVLYKGSTNNMKYRLYHHNTGKSPYTSLHTPWELVIVEEFETRSLAMRREKWYKTGVGREWINEQLKNSSAG
jgi:putative endonuclease